jgi:hypothetical protein
MALDYSFDISSTLSPESLMRSFLMSLGMLGNLKNAFEAGTKNFYVMANRLEGRSREIAREQFGFEPRVNLTFRTGADTDVEAQEQIVRGTLAICRATTGDAVLLFNGEIILFIRRAGTIYVNTNYWQGDYSLFSPPYELRAFQVNEPLF